MICALLIACEVVFQKRSPLRGGKVSLFIGLNFLKGRSRQFGTELKKPRPARFIGMVRKTIVNICILA